uniref:p14K n=1 Tax=Pseudomonas putida TaxID=303 RepID=O69769_PSEPU|nr:P14K [Pseudomonas putida]
MALCLTSLGSPRRLPWWSACTRPVSFSGKTGPRPSPPKSTLPRSAGESVNDTYYRQWVSALEKLVASLGLVTGGDVNSRAQEWKQAHLNTPHGHPILLAHALCPPAIDPKHKHEPQRSPIKVVAAMA